MAVPGNAGSRKKRKGRTKRESTQPLGQSVSSSSFTLSACRPDFQFQRRKITAKTRSLPERKKTEVVNFLPGSPSSAMLFSLRSVCTYTRGREEGDAEEELVIVSEVCLRGRVRDDVASLKIVFSEDLWLFSTQKPRRLFRRIETRERRKEVILSSSSSSALRPSLRSFLSFFRRPRVLGLYVWRKRK